MDKPLASSAWSRDVPQRLEKPLLIPMAGRSASSGRKGVLPAGAPNASPGHFHIGQEFLDQAGWHVSKKLPVPGNITLIPLPPKSPELNPVENNWQFMRDNWLSNRVFKSYADILDHCCFAWNKLIDNALEDYVPIGRNQGDLV